MALTNHIFHPEEIPRGVVRTVEVDLDVERLPSPYDELVAVVLVRVMVDLVGVPPVLEQVDIRDTQVVCMQRRQEREPLSNSFNTKVHETK